MTVSLRKRVVLLGLIAATAVFASGLGVAGMAHASKPKAKKASAAAYRFGVVGNGGKIPQLELNRPQVVAGITGKVVQIATSNSDGYALTSAGAVWAWGVASYGELGNGATRPYSTRAVKVQFPKGIRIARLANPMPFDGALAIDTQGRAWGWGLNPAGDLCVGGALLTRPAELPLRDVTLATGARTHSLLDSHGVVYACGDGSDGVLGRGSTAGSAKPVRVAHLPAHAHAITLTSSWEGSGVLLSNGAYYDWGYNAAGQVGDGTTTERDFPVHVKLPGPVRQVFQGGSGATNGQTIAMLANGTVWTWGDGLRGQLGDGSYKNAFHPVRIKLPDHIHFVSVNSGGYATYALDGSGRLWDWGGNQNGQLGTGGRPVGTDRPHDTGLHVRQISSTASNVAALGRR
jgi:alpha-tubulin suppressor-like RCC1 family protein